MGRKKINSKIRRIILTAGNEKEILELNAKEDFEGSKEETTRKIRKMKKKIIELKLKLGEYHPEMKPIKPIIKEKGECQVECIIKKCQVKDTKVPQEENIFNSEDEHNNTFPPDSFDSGFLSLYF
ncbi:hypothetical protein M9Y10_023056 [Tritrichomonas musculus]|uniref:Uncharacterized protein n=1 Tax=Tritrichomonas musculus TaxID=1915356 RepID=A0ABR2KU31_9EUKA